jgi:hypothetical protein
LARLEFPQPGARVQAGGRLPAALPGAPRRRRRGGAGREGPAVPVPGRSGRSSKSWATNPRTAAAQPGLGRHHPGDGQRERLCPRPPRPDPARPCRLFRGVGREPAATRLIPNCRISGYLVQRRRNSSTSREAPRISFLSRPGFKLSGLGTVRAPWSGVASSLSRTWLPLVRTTLNPIFLKIAMASRLETSLGSLRLIERSRLSSSVSGSGRERFLRGPHHFHNDEHPRGPFLRSRNYGLGGAGVIINQNGTTVESSTATRVVALEHGPAPSRGARPDGHSARPAAGSSWPGRPAHGRSGGSAATTCTFRPRCSAGRSHGEPVAAVEQAYGSAAAQPLPGFLCRQASGCPQGVAASRLQVKPPLGPLPVADAGSAHPEEPGKLTLRHPEPGAQPLHARAREGRGAPGALGGRRSWGRRRR